MIRFPIIALVLSITSICFASVDYRCTVTGAFQVDTNGQQQTNILKHSVGSQFTVERKSGIMAGSLKNMYVTKPVVIDYGSKENSYKVINTMKSERTSNIYSLTVEEFIEGPRKPFIFLNNADVYYGTCEHF